MKMNKMNRINPMQRSGNRSTAINGLLWTMLCLVPVILAMVATTNGAAAYNETVNNRIPTYVSHPMQMALNSEAQSASDLAAYYGYDLTAAQIMDQLPRSDDPTLGFVGDPSGKPSLPPSSYGVYPGPLANTLYLSGVPARAIQNWTLDELRMTVGEGHPVIVWVVGHTARGKSAIYTSKKGNEVIVAEQMNTVTIDGFNEGGFSVWDNGKNYYRTYVDFDASWKILGRMALIIEATPPVRTGNASQPMVLAPYEPAMLSPFEEAGTTVVQTFPAADTVLTALQPSATASQASADDWWNQDLDQYWQSSKDALAAKNETSDNVFRWDDDDIALFGQLPEVIPDYNVSGNGFGVTDADPWQWTQEYGASSGPTNFGESIWQGPYDKTAHFGTYVYAGLDGPTPASAMIDGFVGYPQSFNLDCETRSAVDLAAYFGVPIDAMTFLTSLPKSDDPNEGFVGNYWDERGGLPPRGYGVYEAPVANLLSAFGLPSIGVTNFSWDGIKAQVAAGKPVMTWVIGNTTSGVPQSYTPSNGRTTTVAKWQHTVVVVGYDETAGTVTLQDGGMRYTRSIQTFLDSWAILGNRAIIRSDA